MMSEEAFSETHNDGSSPEEQWSNNNHTRRKERLPGARTSRSSARLCSASPDVNRKPTLVKKEKDEHQQQCSKIITQLVDSTPPSPSQLPRWNLRSMWELASLLNFLHTFRPLLNISHEFSVEELETALITPNSTLDDIHIPLLKAIPPVTRMALGRATWVTVLCRKLRDWWHWVADGEIPIVASHGTEVEVYKSLDPGIRVVILKALCDIRVEQEDIRNFIDDSLKQGVQLSAFRKERMGGDSHGISYWYENDPIIGHRLYREIRKVEVKKVKAKRIPVLPTVTCQWETVATNLDEFMEVSEKLFSSKNRTEAAVGKKLKIDMLPEIEKIHKRREKLLKKQHRQALLIDNFLITDGISSGRSLRDRKPVTYTFDDYDRSISEAIKITKRKQSSPEPLVRREATARPEASTNGSPSQAHQHVSSDAMSPRSTDYEETDEENSSGSGPLDRSNRRRQRPQRYSEKEFVEAVSDNEADFDSDDDIVGEAVYDDEYLRSRKQRKVSSSSEGDEEYRWDEESGEDEEEEEEEDEDDSLSSSEEPRAHRTKKLPSRRSKTGTRSRSIDESGLRRSKRKSRTHINYRQLEVSESETESTKPEKSKESSPGDSNASNETEYSMGSQDEPETGVEEPVQVFNKPTEKEQDQPPENTNTPGEEEIDGVLNRRFLDLNELAPSTSFDDSPIIKADDMDDF